MRRLTLIVALTALSAAPAAAHLDPAEHGSLMAGLTHPPTGADHVLAMVTVGVWAALLGGRALWLVPAAFVSAMTLGFAASLSGVSLPFVEPMVLASVVILGLLAAMALRMPTAAGMALAGFFALFHGYAHGSELGGAGAAPFAIGFIASTAALHGFGMLLGSGLMRAFGSGKGRLAARVVGAIAALGGVAIATT